MMTFVAILLVALAGTAGILLGSLVTVIIDYWIESYNSKMEKKKLKEKIDIYTQFLEERGLDNEKIMFKNLFY